MGNHVFFDAQPKLLQGILSKEGTWIKIPPIKIRVSLPSERDRLNLYCPLDTKYLMILWCFRMLG